jgi:hypothetical protein
MLFIMSTSPLTNQPIKSSLNWSSLIQCVFSALAAFLLLGAAAIIALTSAFQSLSSGSGNPDPTQSFMIAASLAFVGVLVLPSVWYSWRHLANPKIEPVYRPERRSFGLILTILVLVLMVGALWLGNWVSKDARIAWLLLPPLNILATGLPALWLIYIGTHGLLPNTPKRKWGVFASGLVLGPFIILILELLLLIGMGILAILWIMFDPSLSPQLNGLLFRLQNTAPNTDAVLNLLLPFLLNPGVLLIGLAFISVLVPIIEETLKPLGVWFLAGQKITSAQGFGYGVISGAGFGLFENLGNTSSAGDAWAILAASRITTLLLHCFTAGLVGWALASAWSQRRYLRLGITFVVAVLVHGLWNGMAVLSAASSMQGVANISIPASLQRLGALASEGIIALGILVLVMVVGFNTVLRRNVFAMISTPPDDAQTPIPSGNAPQSVSTVTAYLPTSEINPALPLTPGDNPSKPETSPHQQSIGENPPKASETNP